MENFSNFTVNKNSRFALAFSILGVAMIFGSMFSPHAFAQSIYGPASNSNFLKNILQTTYTDPRENQRILVDKLVSNGIEHAKGGQDQQSRSEFLGALKQVYPELSDYVIMADKKSKTVLLGENNDAIVYAHFYQDDRKNSFEIVWKHPYPVK